jgi:hypothetical protein
MTMSPGSRSKNISASPQTWSSYMKRNHYVLSLFLAVTFLMAHTATFATDIAPEGENLFQVLPSGFQIGNQQSGDHIDLTEMVPNGESVDAWTQLITIQVFRGIENPDFFDVYRKGVEQTFKKSCDSTEFLPFHDLDGKENGYPVHLWMQFCRYKNPDKAPEVTLFKYIQGHDAAYIVQWASHSEPTKEEFKQRMRYLSKVLACDTRRKENPCSMPSLK